MKADPVNIDLSLLLKKMHRQKLDRRDHKSLKYIYEKSQVQYDSSLTSSQEWVSES